VTLDVPAALPDGTGTVKVEIRMSMSVQQLANLPDHDQVMSMTADEATLLARWS
jgi:hypothetical protein